MKNSDNCILVLNRSFWPDTEATGQFLTELCEELARIHKVVVIAGRSYFVREEVFKRGRFYSREIFNNINILRVRHTLFWKGCLVGRLINWLTYGILTFIAALRIKSRLVIACTDPPFTGIIAMIISRLKSIPFIYNCRDLYPDITLALGKLKKGFISNLFDYLNKKALINARLVVCVGASMKERLMAKGIPEDNICIVPDWVDTTKIKPVLKDDNPLLKKIGLKEKFIIMYSGNIGLSQDFNSVLFALTLVKDFPSVYLIFVGEGAMKKTLEEQVQKLGLRNVLFFPYQPKDMLSFSLSMADLHIVPLKKGMAGAITPSKVYGIMAAARPYLAMTDRESEAARLVDEFGCGLWAAPGDIKTIADTLNWAFEHPHKLEEMGRKGRRVAESSFDKEVVIKEWFKLLTGF